MSFSERIRKSMEEYQQKVKENPRYAIDFLADDEGNVRIFFTPEGYRDYVEGKEVTGSTERFESNDIIHRVPKERIDKITHGGTIAHIRGSYNE